jgi:phospholipase C
MGYYDRRDLPYYWAVAEQYVLFDRFFASARHGIRTNRSYWVSAAPQPGGVDSVGPEGYGDQLTIFDRLQAAGVSWKFYVEGYNARETFRARSAIDPAAQTVRSPLLNYARFVDDPALNSHIVDLSQYYKDLAAGQLPAVSYVTSSGSSERSARSLGAGQDLVRHMITQLEVSSAWSSSALMWSYDGSGGWFDHVAPPTVRGRVLGPRVPALLVSPYVGQGAIDHTQLDYTGALRFIEDNWQLKPMNELDGNATSIATAFRFDRPARAPEVVHGGPPTTGPRVDVSTAYLGYLSALAMALGLFLAAVTGPSVVRGWRRRRARAGADGSGRASVGVVVRHDIVLPVETAPADRAAPGVRKEWPR